MTALQVQIFALKCYQRAMGSACRGSAKEADTEALLTNRNIDDKKTDEEEKEVDDRGHVKDAKGSGSLNEGIRKHEPVPTPSMREINAAMENLYKYTNTGDDDGERVVNELLPALPTMGDAVSNLHLKMANPLGGLSVNPQDSSTMLNSDPRSTVIQHSTPNGVSVSKLHLEEGASAQESNDTKTVFAPRQIVGNVPSISYISYISSIFCIERD